MCHTQTEWDRNCKVGLVEAGRQKAPLGERHRKEEGLETPESYLFMILKHSCWQSVPFPRGRHSDQFLAYLSREGKASF